MEKEIEEDEEKGVRDWRRIENEDNKERGGGMFPWC